MDENCRSILVEETALTIAQHHIGIDHVGAQLAVLADELVGHVAGMRTILGLMAVLLPLLAVVVISGLEAGVRLALANLMNVEAVLAGRKPCDINVDQDPILPVWG